MDLGSRIKHARLEAGLSQRQLCGGHMTRNMLSQIENGSAKPSMKTLAWLAGQLNKPMSYFLDEETVSPDQSAAARAREALACANWMELRKALDSFQEPEGPFKEERLLLEFLYGVGLGEQALKQGRLPYARKLLQTAAELPGLYITLPLRRRCQVLLVLAGDQGRADCDPEALLAMAMGATDAQRQLEILGASENKADPRWNLLQAEALFRLQRYAEAAICYRQAAPGKAVYEKLEICFRELGDYKQAYEYACLQREAVK